MRGEWRSGRSAGGDEPQPRTRPVVYCLIPRALAGELHERLRQHFREHPGVEVVVEHRRGDRRRRGERRTSERPVGEDRRVIGGLGGRRAGERRAALVAVDPLELPRAARRHADRLAFVERLEPSGDYREDLDTAWLVTRFQAGDPDAFSTIYRRYFDRVYSYLLVVMRDSHAAEDTAQQVFMQAWEALPRYERRAQPFRAWLFRIVRNLALMELRKRGRLDVVDPAEISRRREVAQPTEHDLSVLTWISDRELTIFIERLPLAQQQALLLRYVFGLRAAEIADVLGRSPNDVAQLQSRALRFLRGRLAALGRTGSRGQREPIRRRVLQARVLRSRRYSLR